MLAAAQTKPSFDVASIKHGEPNSRQVGIHRENSGRFTTTNTTLRILIGYAYGVSNYQISGGPSWIDSDAFTIEAKPDSETFPAGANGQAQIPLMLQSLLAERFELSVHWETKAQPIYELVI